MEKQTITIYDVAREANVSMATVSRVVNGNPNVKPATRKRVLDVIDELDYRPNAVARGLASKKTTTVGVIIPDVTNLYFASLARGIDDIATMYKYNIILANSDQNNHKEIQVLNTLLSKQVDGILYMGNHLTPELRTEIIRSKTPIVLAGTMDAEHEIASVNIDYKEATQEAVETLIENGHKKVAFVTAALKNIASVDSRLEGYKAALDKAGLLLNTSEGEAFGMNVLEALNHGVPVVAYKVKYGLNEQIEDGGNGYLVPYGAIQTAADSVIEIIRSKANWDKFSRSAYAKAKEYSEEAVWSQWLNEKIIVDSLFIK